MTDSNDDFFALIGALLWLRNHYDVGDPALKGEVLRHVDKLLDRHSEKFAFSRREWARKLHAKDQAMVTGKASDIRTEILTNVGEDIDRLSVRLGGPKRVAGETDADYRMRLFAFSCLIPIGDVQ